MAVTEDVFEDVKEIRNQYGSTTSDILAVALQNLKRDLAKRNAQKA